MQRQAAGRAWWSLLAVLSLAITANTAVGEDSPPHGVDLIQYGGNGKTVVIQMLNLTPYDITYLQSDLKESTDNDRDKKKAMMFAPVGVPQLLPKVPPDAYNNSNFRNTSTHLYSGVVSWCDCDDTVKNSSITWQVNGVKYSYLDQNNQVHTGTGNPKVQLYFTRSAPEKSLKASFFYVVKQAMNIGLMVAGIVVEGENPLTWIHAFLAIDEFARGTSEFIKENTAQDNGSKMWVGAYVIPETGTCKGVVSGNCMPSKNANDDAVDAQWGSTTGGLAESEIIVTTQLLRGSTYFLGVGAAGSTYGDLPIVQLTIWDAATYIAAYKQVTGTQYALTQSGKKLQTLTHQRGRAGLLDLRNLIKSMDPKDRDILMQAHLALSEKRTLNDAQKAILDGLTTAFEKKEKTWKAETGAKGGASHVH